VTDTQQIATKEVKRRRPTLEEIRRSSLKQLDWLILLNLIEQLEREIARIAQKSSIAERQGKMI